MRPPSFVRGHVLVLASAVVLPGTTSAAAATMPGPCHIVGKTDVQRVLGWHVASVRERRYDFGGLSGGMCNLSGADGTVTVIVPDLGSTFPGITPDNALDGAATVRPVRGLGADVQLFNGTVFVTSGHRKVEVRVEPQSRPASDQEIEPFARVVLTHLAR